MNTTPITPCLWFDSQAAEAAAFYTKTFAEHRINATSHYPESVETPSDKPAGTVLTVDFEIAGQRFTALNGGPHFVKNPAVSFFVHVESVEEANRLFSILEEGGKVLMPIAEYPWSPRFGWVEDRFGVSWQVIAGRRSQGGATIVPCLMFFGANRGKAQEAMNTYTGIFPEGRVDSVEKYTGEEGPKGWVKHARFRISGQEMIAMDSPIDHGFAFNEGISLQVFCEEQDEIDRYWEALSEGGKPGVCGWLKDRYGLSWQIVPSRMAKWMSHPDKAARERVFAAMMQMKKLDIPALQKAFEGG